MRMAPLLSVKGQIQPRGAEGWHGSCLQVREPTRLLKKGNTWITVEKRWLRGDGKTTAPHLGEVLLLAMPRWLLVSAFLSPAGLCCLFFSCFAGGDGRVKDSTGEKNLSPTPGIEKDAEQRNQT